MYPDEFGTPPVEDYNAAAPAPEAPVPPAPVAPPVPPAPEYGPAPVPPAPQYAPAPEAPAPQPYAPAPQPQPQYAPAPYAPEGQNAGPDDGKGMGIASLVLGAVGFILSFVGIGAIAGIIGLILGISAKKKSAQYSVTSGLSIAGIVLSIIAIFIGLLMLLIGGSLASIFNGLNSSGYYSAIVSHLASIC